MQPYWFSTYLASHNSLVSLWIMLKSPPHAKVPRVFGKEAKKPLCLTGERNGLFDEDRLDCYFWLDVSEARAEGIQPVPRRERRSSGAGFCQPSQMQFLVDCHAVRHRVTRLQMEPDVERPAGVLGQGAL